jgi:hypothetical protein
MAFLECRNGWFRVVFIEMRHSMQQPRPEMVEARQHDALNGLAFTVKNSHQINPRLLKV